MGARVYFHADRITVWANAMTVGKHVYSIKDIAGVRCERLRVKWLWPLPIDTFALVLTMLDGRQIRAVRHRNAYFIFQLVNAVQAAIEDAQSAIAPLAENSSA